MFVQKHKQSPPPRQNDATRLRARLNCEALETREVPTIYPVNVLVDAPANLNDEPETLRDALTRANDDNTAGPHRIQFADNLAGGTINLQSILPILDKDISIEGLTNKITLRPDPGGAGNFRMLKVNPDKLVSITNMKFTEGKSIDEAQGGGAIYSQGKLTVSSCEFIHNTASETFGGAIQAWSGTLDVSTSVFLNNIAHWGGAIAIGPGVTAANISYSVISLNYASQDGGGVHISALDCVVAFCGVDMGGNIAVKDGGGISSSLANLVLTGGTNIHGNTAQTGTGGGVYINGGSITYAGVTVGYNGSAIIGDGISRHNATRIDVDPGLTLQGGDIEWHPV